MRNFIWCLFLFFLLFVSEECILLCCQSLQARSFCWQISSGARKLQSRCSFSDSASSHLGVLVQKMRSWQSNAVLHGVNVSELKSFFFSFFFFSFFLIIRLSHIPALWYWETWEQSRRLKGPTTDSSSSMIPGTHTDGRLSLRLMKAHPDCYPCPLLKKTRLIHP